ncbi:hypothetical protein F5Y04DRAFT_285161 [Hypomontagnella monticulosa]|nr:hypothetical protein F5Y04DRAFT_285161 [Hypomontagnella monticulosa]
MKTSFASIFLTTAALMSSAMASPTFDVVEARGNNPLPDKDKPYICNTQSNSAGTSNIKEALNKLQKIDKGCAPGKDGKAVWMVKDDGVKLFIGSTGGQQTGNFDCKDLVTPFQLLLDYCAGNVAGDYRAGGAAWVPGYEGRTYVYPTNHE